MSPSITCYTLVLLAFVHITPVRSLFYFTNKDLKFNKSESFVIPYENLEITRSGKSPVGMGTNLFLYRNISSTYSTDERCETGLPLSMAILTNAPYVYDRNVFELIRPIFAFVNGTMKMVRAPGMKGNFTYFGVFPGIIRKGISKCCHPKSDIRYAKMLFEQSVPAEVDSAKEYDFSFPMYGDSMEATMYKSNPFIPLVQAPRVALLVPKDKLEGKTHFIATTIIKTWPMFLFILLTSCSSGIIMWFLDSSSNEEEFPRPFSSGVWEGFWWAFITLTTVGYGDRTPKSFLGRFFCILWIIFGIVIISILSGLMTTALYASTNIHFSIHGARIGAVTGSQEFNFGLSLNADMRDFDSSTKAFTELVYFRRIDGILVDSYVASIFGKYLYENNVRTDRMMDYPITYGIRMAEGSERLTKCLRKYLRNHPQEVFDLLSKSFNSQKNPIDRENLREQEALKLFSRDTTMDNMLMYGGYFIASVLLIGVCYQVLMHIISKRRGSTFTHHVVNSSTWGAGSFKDIDNPVKVLMAEYNCFQNGWMKKMKAIHQE